MGRFDVVLFCGVLYHLRDMLAGLTAAASVADRMLIVETHMDAADIHRPAAVFYPGAELNGDASNWWGPNQLCVEAMLSVLGFPRWNTRHTRPCPRAAYSEPYGSSPGFVIHRRPPATSSSVVPGSAYEASPCRHGEAPTRR